MAEGVKDVAQFQPQVRREGKNKTGLNLETYGSVGKRWDDSPREKQRGMKAEGKEGGRHTEIKREVREARGGR